MAFSNKTTTNITSRTEVYEAPIAGSIIIGITVCNTSSQVCKFSIDLEGVYIVKDIPLTPGNAFSPLDGKIVLTNGQTLNVVSDYSVDSIVSALDN